MLGVKFSEVTLDSKWKQPQQISSPVADLKYGQLRIQTMLLKSLELVNSAFRLCCSSLWSWSGKLPKADFLTFPFKQLQCLITIIMVFFLPWLYLQLEPVLLQDTTVSYSAMLDGAWLMSW